MEDGGASRLSKHKTGGFQPWLAGWGRDGEGSSEDKVGRLLEGWGRRPQPGLAV